MEASKSLSSDNNNLTLFSAVADSSNMYSNKDSNLISELFMVVSKHKDPNVYIIHPLCGGLVHMINQ